MSRKGRISDVDSDDNTDIFVDIDSDYKSDNSNTNSKPNSPSSPRSPSSPSRSRIQRLKTRVDPRVKGCHLCFRTGKAIIGTPYTCPTCHGTGKVRRCCWCKLCWCCCTRERKKCKACEGRKFLFKNRKVTYCGLCGGDGILKRTKTEMAIAAGKTILRIALIVEGIDVGPGVDMCLEILSGGFSITGDFGILEVVEGIAQEVNLDDFTDPDKLQEKAEEKAKEKAKEKATEKEKEKGKEKRKEKAREKIKEKGKEKIKKKLNEKPKQAYAQYKTKKKFLKEVKKIERGKRCCCCFRCGCCCCGCFRCGRSNDSELQLEVAVANGGRNANGNARG